MSRMLLAAGFLFCLLVQSALCDEPLQSSIRTKQDKTNDAIVKNISGRTVDDLGPVLAKMRSENKLVEGRNRILTTKPETGIPAVTLWATVTKGLITKWEAVDANGNKLSTNTTSEVRSAARKCKVCYDIIDGDGVVLAKRCIYVPCKDTPKVSTTGTKAQ